MQATFGPEAQSTPTRRTLITDYLSRRQNVVNQDPAALPEFNAHLDALADRFGLSWLESDHGNPVQQLWRSTDALATNELLNLGRAVQNLSARNTRWTERQVNVVKSPNPGRRAGAIFELLCLDLFNRPGQQVVPAGDDQEGFDGRVDLSDGSLLVSIKNHGLSSNESAFLQSADEIHREFVDILDRNNANELDVRIMALSQPTAADWKVLRGQIGDMVTGRKPADNPVWQGFLRRLDPSWRPLSSAHKSYAFLLLAPYHKNEQKNFEDKIAAGIANLEKHCSQVASDVCRVLFMRLSASASLPECEKWTKEYYGLYPATNVEVIVLYQAAVTTDLSKGTSQISHYYVSVQGPKYQAWRDGGTSPRVFSLETLVGNIETKATRMVMTDGTIQMDLNRAYVYQRSEINRHYDPQKGQTDAVLSNPAPGVFINAVFGNGLALKMKRPHEARLLLLP
jgi:hypothetical protein